MEVHSKQKVRQQMQKVKDEAGGIPSNEFVGLRSEMYSYMKDSYKGSKTAKGIKKNVVKKSIKYENYKNT